MSAKTLQPGRKLAAGAFPLPGMLILRDLLRVLAGATVGVGAVLALLPAAGHDQTWCLYVAGRMLDGARLYGPDIFESNPPLIMWLSTIPVALARVARVEPGFAAKFVTLLALAVSFGISLPLVRRCLLQEKPAPISRSALAAACTSFFAAAFLCIPARDFGQREHLLSFLVLPYLLFAAIDARHHPATFLRVIASAIAALGICLKPQQAVFPVAVELLLLLRARSLRTLLRPEPVLLLSGCVAYVSLIRLLTPQYFTTTLPILRITYWAIGHLSLGELFAQSWQMQCLFLLTLLLLWLRRARLSPALRDLTYVFTAAGAGSDLAYLQQGTGWYYQQLPAIVFFSAALSLLFGYNLHRVLKAGTFQTPSPRRLLPAAIALSFLAVFLSLHFSGYPVTTDRAYAITSPNPALFRDLSPGTPVAILTTSVDEAIMSVARYHLFWAQRTNNLWWMPAILRSQNATHLTPAQIAMLSGLQHRNMAEDLQRWQPRLVLIERCYDPSIHCQVIEDLHPNLLAWFNTDLRFRQAFLPYRFTGTDARFDVYERVPETRNRSGRP